MKFVAISLAGLAFAFSGCSSGNEGSNFTSSIAALETESSTTTSTTTLPPLADPTIETLFTAVPSPLELPAGWTSTGGLGSSELIPAEGNNLGNCGGPNAAKRAISAGVVVHYENPAFVTPFGYAGIAFYAFRTAEAAQRFMDDTAAKSQCPSYPEYTIPDSEFGGFGETQDVDWTVRDSYSVGGAGVEVADSSFSILQKTESFTRLRGTDYGWREELHSIYERHGRIVIVSSLRGDCCDYGFSNVETTVDYRPTLADLTTGMDTIRPVILSKLRLNNLIR
jgi:hypothetical protein